MKPFGVEVIQIILQHQSAQFFSIYPLRIINPCRAVDDAQYLDLRTSIQQELHAVSGHIAVWTACHSHGKGILIDIQPDLLHGDFCKLHHSPRGDTVFFVIDTDTLAGHDTDTEEVTATDGLSCDQLDHVVMHVLVRPQLDGLVLSVIVDHPWICGPTLFGHENIQEGVEESILNFV